ncbi:hypothetical protein EV146_102422 [Mesobacillus foraminis]|jgi:hypothetical protein|uniref:Uncharacterized protein n=1 Tax=Mesobacillus foraminis TaxID=279826 RepID=A0A4R2BMQ0_9BACI|nr:hypothetical protein EV146_102422 [Mesobacillus foraminis]
MHSEEYYLYIIEEIGRLINEYKKITCPKAKLAIDKKLKLLGDELLV